MDDADRTAMESRWAEMDAHIRALAALMLEGDMPSSVKENLEQREYDLALSDLAEAVAQASRGS